MLTTSRLALLMLLLGFTWLPPACRERAPVPITTVELAADENKRPSEGPIRVTGVSPAEIHAGEVFVIEGENFAGEVGTLKVYVGSTEATVLESTDTEIHCTVQRITRGNLLVARGQRDSNQTATEALEIRIISSEDVAPETLTRHIQELREGERPRPGQTFRATVEYVFDGDSVRLDNGWELRYIGLNTPERGEPLSDDARDRNRRLVEGHEIEVTAGEDVVDMHGRLLGYVYLPHEDGLFLNELLIKEGFARPHTFPETTRFLTTFLEADAFARDHAATWWRDIMRSPIRIVDEDRIVPGPARVQFRARHCGKTSSGLVYLRASDNGFGAVIRGPNLLNFERSGIPRPEEFFKNQRITVLGMVEENQHGLQIDVITPAQILYD